MKVLVTGGNGFLGTAVVRRLRSVGYEVAAPKSTEYDLRDPDQIIAALEDTEPEIVVHLAAIVGGIGANDASPGRFLYENAVMGLNLMEQARIAGVRKFVTVGTACSYPAAAPLPLREDTIWDGYPAEPTAPYGLAKRMLLAQGQAYRREYGFNAVHLIPTNLYGPRDNFDLESGHVAAMLIHRFSEARRTGAPGETLWGTGEATREFLYVEDAARGIVAAVASYDRPEPVNLGTGVETSIAALAHMIAGLYGFEGDISWDRVHPNGATRRVLDVTRAKVVFDFTAKTKLSEGLWRTVEWYEQ